jgi:predicted amidohydrolase YtcJ
MQTIILSRRFRGSVLGCFWCALFLLATVGAQQAAGQASIVLHNGKVLTVDKNFSTAQAVAITGNKFSMVGRNEDVLKQAGPNTQVIDLKGRMVVPGLFNTHIHIPGAEAQLAQKAPRAYDVDWRGVRTKQDVLNQIQALMDKNKPKPGEWLLFRNQLQLDLNSPNPGAISGNEQAKILYDELTRYDLDKVSPNNPIILTMSVPSENLLFVNSAAIDVVWKTDGDFVKKYGRYWMGTNGQPDGHLEPPATRLILSRYAPMEPAAELAKVVSKAINGLSAQGVTTITTKIRENGLAAYKLLDAQGEQRVRLGYGAGFDPFGATTDLDAGLKKYQNLVGTGTDKLWITSVAPSSIDGANTRACTNLTRQTALAGSGAIDKWFPVGQCHTDQEYRGGSGRAANITGNYFRDWVITMGKYDIRLANDHSEGDRSTGNILSMIEAIRQQYPKSAQNWALDHCFLVDPKDFARIGKYGVMFTCSPGYINSGAATAASYGDKVANTYISPVKSMMDAGSKVSIQGTGWEPIEHFQTRKDREGRVWGPQERVDKITALRMPTNNAAAYVLKPELLGSIEVGKLADLAVIDRDYLTIPVEDVHNIVNLMTVMDGKIVFEHPKFAEEYNLRAAGALIATPQELGAIGGGGD